MLALIPALVLAAALQADPVFVDATGRVQQDAAAEAIPLFQSLMGSETLTDAERAEIQLWLATCYALTDDPLRMRGHVQRAVTLDPDVTAPEAATPEVRAALAELKPKPPVPWIESPAGVATVTGLGIAGLGAGLLALSVTDLLVTSVWLDGWYDALEDSGEVAAPRAYADFVAKQNDRYKRVREGYRANVGVSAAAGLLMGAGVAISLAGLLTPRADETE